MSLTPDLLEPCIAPPLASIMKLTRKLSGGGGGVSADVESFGSKYNFLKRQKFQKLKKKEFKDDFEDFFRVNFKDDFKNDFEMLCILLKQLCVELFDGFLQID